MTRELNRPPKINTPVTIRMTEKRIIVAVLSSLEYFCSMKIDPVERGRESRLSIIASNQNCK